MVSIYGALGRILGTVVFFSRIAKNLPQSLFLFIWWVWQTLVLSELSREGGDFPIIPLFLEFHSLSPRGGGICPNTLLRPRPPVFMRVLWCLVILGFLSLPFHLERSGQGSVVDLELCSLKRSYTLLTILDYIKFSPPPPLYQIYPPHPFCITIPS